MQAAGGISMTQIDLALRRRCIDHMIRAIAETPTMTDPFPHFVVRCFFPNAVYSDLLELLPDSSHYEVTGYDRHQNAYGEGNRKCFNMRNDRLDRLDRRGHTFWRTIRSALGSPELKRASYAKLSTGLALRYSLSDSPGEIADIPGFAMPELFRESGGYNIKPHPDTRQKVVTMQIALPRDASQRELGTEFYRRSINPLSLIRPPRGFSIVKTMEFLPNTAYAFSVLNTLRLKSWHGRTVIADSSGERNSILNIWYEKPKYGAAEVHEENWQLGLVNSERSFAA
jgi:hypothetical protein